MRMRLPDFSPSVEREMRYWFRMLRGKRTRDERWAMLSQRIVAYEQSQYTWTPQPHVWREHRVMAIMVPWGIWPRFIA